MSRKATPARRLPSVHGKRATRYHPLKIVLRLLILAPVLTIAVGAASRLLQALTGS